MTTLPERVRFGFSPSSWMDLESEWWSELAHSHRTIPRTFGSEGEDRLLNSLLLNPPSDQHYYIPNLLLEDNLDADAVLVGPTGIWILESKYISGKIRFRDGIWTREKSYFGPGGFQKTKDDEFPEIEKQWDRERNIVWGIVKKHLPYIASLDATYIQGGLVFTHEKCDIGFKSAGKVEFGNINNWVEDIGYGGLSYTDGNHSRLRPDQVLKIVDVLLNHSKSIDPKQTISAVNVALSVNEYQEEIATDLYDMHAHLISLDEDDCELTEETMLEIDQAVDQAKEGIYKMFETG